MMLVDPFGRKATGLRIALTSRCNLKCIYCHHEGDVAHKDEISCEMAANLAKAAADLGMHSIKFTGGEPLMRSDLEDILSQMPDCLDLSMTTNGIFLADRAGSLAEAGLDRVNISLDSLNPKTYRSITGGREGDMEKVIDGIEAAKDRALFARKIPFVVSEVSRQSGISDKISSRSLRIRGSPPVNLTECIPRSAAALARFAAISQEISSLCATSPSWWQ
jgi:cyclic pyranopterin phosphate synthase